MASGVVDVFMHLLKLYFLRTSSFLTAVQHQLSALHLCDFRWRSSDSTFLYLHLRGLVKILCVCNLSWVCVWLIIQTYIHTLTVPTARRLSSLIIADHQRKQLKRCSVGQSSPFSQSWDLVRPSLDRPVHSTFTNHFFPLSRCWISHFPSSLPWKRILDSHPESRDQSTQRAPPTLLQHSGVGPGCLHDAPRCLQDHGNPLP